MTPYERGMTLVELLVTTTLLGLLLVVTAPLTTALLRAAAPEEGEDALWALRFGAVPQLRQDLRQARSIEGGHGWLAGGTDAMAITSRSAGHTVIWMTGTRLLIRREVVRAGETLRVLRERTWRGPFVARLSDEGLVAGLDVDSLTGEGRALVRFRHAVGR